MPPWTLAPCLELLRDELNAAWPNRDTHSDGAIGDAAHRAEASDHNPNAQGVVCAYDIDTDLDGTDDSNDLQMEELVARIRANPHPNLKYLIFRGHMFSAYSARGIQPFQWRPYPGPDPHTSHVHISVGVGADGKSMPGTYDDLTPWAIDTPYPPIHPAPEEEEDDDMALLIIQPAGPEETGSYLVDTSSGLVSELVAGSDLDALKAGGAKGPLGYTADGWKRLKAHLNEVRTGK